MFCFYSSNSLEYFEVQFIVQLLYEFSPPAAVLNAIAPLANNSHSIVTLPEFVLVCRHYPIVLRPMITFRDSLKEKIIFRRFWSQIAARRVYYLGDKPHHSILDHLTADRQLDVLQSFLFSNEHVDKTLATQWLEVVNRKPSDVVEKLPFEIDPEYEAPEMPSPVARSEKVIPPHTSMYK